MEPEHPVPASELAPPGDSAPDGLERRVIAAFLATRPTRPDWVTVDAGHDCAVIDGGVALKVDTLVAGVHFDAGWTAVEVGWKAVTAAVSDLAAAGSLPRWALVSVSARDPRWAAALAEGVGAACAAWGVYLVGGDVTRVPAGSSAVVSVSAGGACVARPVTRSGAHPGDHLWVTGTLGLAGVGWATPAPPAAALRALRRPEPPVAFALDLARRGLVAAAMDLSDGPRSDLPRLAAASGVHLVVHADALPLAPEVAASADPLRFALCGGDDHQLLFAARPADGHAIQALAAGSGVQVTRIGEVEAGSGVGLVGAAWPAPMFSHFDAAGVA